MPDALFGALELAHVLNGALQVLHVTRGIEGTHALHLNVPQCAVRTHDPHTFSGKLAGFEQAVKRIAHQITVVGMHQIDEWLEANTGRINLQPENSISLARPVDRVTR